MIATYHNHSNWSDGKASIEQIIAAAVGMGVDEVGISDHWVLHPRGTQFKWAMPTDRLPDYVSAIKHAQSQSNSQACAVRLGIEVDWHIGNAQRLRDVLAQYPFDYIIGSVHEIVLDDGSEFMIDGSPAAWQPLGQDRINHVHQQYWKTMKTLAQSEVFDIVAHIDLPKKFPFFPTLDLSREIGEALDAIAAATNSAGQRLAVELNTAGWHKPCGDAYPSLDILRECNRRGIPSMMNADAHQPEHLLRDFDRAANRFAEAGYTHLTRFAQRAWRLEPLTECVPRL
jgi:histidinol-phosphatase (PHP family)